MISVFNRQTLSSINPKVVVDLPQQILFNAHLANYSMDAGFLSDTSLVAYTMGLQPFGTAAATQTELFQVDENNFTLSQTGTQVYDVITRHYLNSKDAVRIGATAPAINDLVVKDAMARQAIAYETHDMLLFGTGAGNQGILNVTGSTDQALPPDTSGNTSWSTENPLTLASFIIGLAKDIYNTSVNMVSEIAFACHTDLYTYLVSESNIPPTSAAENYGASFKSIWQYILYFLGKENADGTFGNMFHLTLHYDNTLIAPNGDYYLVCNGRQVNAQPSYFTTDLPPINMQGDLQAVAQTINREDAVVAQYAVNALRQVRNPSTNDNVQVTSTATRSVAAALRPELIINTYAAF